MTDVETRSQWPARIAVTAPVLDGGIGRNIVNLANAWSRFGVSVDVVLDRADGSYVGMLDERVEVHVSGGSHPVRKVPWLAAYLRRRRPDALLTPVPRHTVWALRARTLSRHGVSIFANVHNNYEVTLERLTPKKRASRVRSLARHYPRTQGVIAVSRGAADAFGRVIGGLPRNTVSLPNPVNVEEVHRLAQGAGQNCDTSAAPTFCFLGRFNVQKNVPLLLDAFDRLRGERSARLRLIGSGEEEGVIRDRVAHSPYAADIELLGHQANPYPFLAASAALVLSSNWEGFGNVLIEAMALGVQVVATDCPSGPREIIGESGSGFLSPVGDVEALAAAMAKSLDTPVPADRLHSEAARYDVGPVATAYLDFMRERHGSV